MNTSKTLAIALFAIMTIAGCATKTVVVPTHQHAQQHVIYKVKPAKAHCWRHRGHWDCRKS